MAQRRSCICPVHDFFVSRPHVSALLPVRRLLVRRCLGCRLQRFDSGRSVQRNASRWRRGGRDRAGPGRRRHRPDGHELAVRPGPRAARAPAVPAAMGSVASPCHDRTVRSKRRGGDVCLAHCTGPQWPPLGRTHEPFPDRSRDGPPGVPGLRDDADPAIGARRSLATCPGLVRSSAGSRRSRTFRLFYSSSARGSETVKTVPCSALLLARMLPP